MKDLLEISSYYNRNKNKIFFESKAAGEFLNILKVKWKKNIAN